MLSIKIEKEYKILDTQWIQASQFPSPVYMILVEGNKLIVLQND